MQLMRGAYPTPKHKMAAAIPHSVSGATPPQFIRIPKVLSMWGNDVFGLCCTAEEFFAKACNSPEIDMPYGKAVKFARQNWILNGAGIWETIEIVRTKGIYFGDSQYLDGAPKSVNFTNPAILKNAIYQGPVKLGVAADQLENVVQAIPNYPVNGFVCTGFSTDGNLDHCVSLCGYGPAAWLMGQLGGTLPKSLAPATPCYALFTWSAIGVIDVPSMVAITGEAWLRTPTTIIKPNPVPAPKAGARP
jgi:hypothetical protein